MIKIILQACIFYHYYKGSKPDGEARTGDEDVEEDSAEQVQNKTIIFSFVKQSSFCVVIEFNYKCSKELDRFINKTIIFLFVKHTSFLEGVRLTYMCSKELDRFINKTIIFSFVKHTSFFESVRFTYKCSKELDRFINKTIIFSSVKLSSFLIISCFFTRWNISLLNVSSTTDAPDPSCRQRPTVR